MWNDEKNQCGPCPQVRAIVLALTQALEKPKHECNIIRVSVNVQHATTSTKYEVVFATVDI